MDITPRLLPVTLAAQYLGVSASKLRSMDIRRKVLDGKRLYDRADLDAYADALPLEQGEANTCDQVFD
jgi:hypothetical protein